MNRKTIQLLILTLCSLAAACGKEDDPAADPRLAIAGTYESMEHIANGGNKGDDLMVKTVPAGIHISVKPAQGNMDALEMDLAELVKTVLGTYVSEPFSIDFQGPVIAVISGNSFQLEAAEFLIEEDGVAIATLNGKGSFDGNTLLLEYEFSVDAQNTILIFKSNGKVELQKDDPTGTQNTQ